MDIRVSVQSITSATLELIVESGIILMLVLHTKSTNEGNPGFTIDYVQMTCNREDVTERVNNC